MYLALKRPLEERVVLSLHEHKEEGDVCPVANTITIQVGSHTHLIAIPIREGLGGVRLPLQRNQ